MNGSNKPEHSLATGAEPTASPSSWWARCREWLRPGRLRAGRVPSDPFVIRSDALVAERYRTLAWLLDQIQTHRVARVIAVTSAIPGEGKSTCALNLAAVLAERSGHEVLLLEGDLRRPTLRMTLQNTGPGTLEVLAGNCSPESAVYKDPLWRFSAISVAEAVEDPMSLLAAGWPVERLLAWARAHYYYVIVDCPPVLPVPDPIFLSEAADAVLYVVRAGETSGRMLSRSLELLNKEKLLGIVFNGAGRGAGVHYYDSYRRAYRGGSPGKRGYAAR